MTSLSKSSDEPTRIGAFAAKTELSKLLRQTRAGKHFIITQRGTPVAELRPIARESKWGDMARKRGDMKGKIWIADDFCEPIEEMREYMD